MNEDEFAESLKRMQEIKLKNEIRNKRNHLKHQFLMPQLHDRVIYTAHNRLGKVVNSGTGIVVKLMRSGEYSLQTMYIVIDDKTQKEVEIMQYHSSYPNDIIEVQQKASNIFYSGYDTLKNVVIPGTLYTNKSDSEDAMTRLFGSKWTENEFYAVLKVKINVIEG